jgi:hypothetical protein
MPAAIGPEDLSGNLIVQLGLVTEDLNRQWYERNTGNAIKDVQCRPFYLGIPKGVSRANDHAHHRDHGFAQRLDNVGGVRERIDWTLLSVAALLL